MPSLLWNCYLLNTSTRSSNHSAYNTLQVLLLFVYATRNTGGIMTLYINSLTSSFLKYVVKTLICDFT